MKNGYYQASGKLSPQIAVSKNNKTIIEFLDRLKFEDNSAQVESGFSRIRIGIQDFSTPNHIYKWANVTPENIRTAYNNLCQLKTSPAAAYEECQKDMIQIIQMLMNNPGVSPNELGFIDAKIRENASRIEKAKKITPLFEEKKILPYETYKNQNNPNEYLITGCRIYYNPAMRIPVIFEVSQGYGQAVKDQVGRVQFRNEHDTVALKKMLTVTEAKSVLGRVVRFCDSMAQIATQRYFELKASGLGEMDNSPRQVENYQQQDFPPPPPQNYSQNQYYG
ncbi:MAG: hypothetical protein K6F27_06380 [Ruminococcus sp.]|nr:hypothetical protein [Ruminococcus sp.]